MSRATKNCKQSKTIVSLVHVQRWIDEVHEIRVRGKVQVYPFFTASESQNYTTDPEDM